MKNNLYIGIMSGTSMNAIDAALVDFNSDYPEIIETISLDFPDTLKKNLNAIVQSNTCDIRALGHADTELGNLFAEACLQLLKKTKLSAREISAIGSHGQTIFHEPNHAHPFTLQIGDPNIIAAKTGITTIADFRRRDLAVGGQAAPLAPIFHQYLFRDRAHAQCVVNIGGIANITFLSGNNIIAFDTGPGNTLMDLFCEQHCGKAFDENGLWARSGKIHAELLSRCLADDYFQKKYPKSTGRDYFNLNWLGEKIFGENILPEDVQATLVELTARTIASSVSVFSKIIYFGSDPAVFALENEPSMVRSRVCRDATRANTAGSLPRDDFEKYREIVEAVWICGGGAYNHFLMERLAYHCKPISICSTAKINIPPEWMEAAAFAFLAKLTLEKKPGNCPSVTGAKMACVLGGIYSA